MPLLTTLFDNDALGDNGGKAAYRLFFATVGARTLRDVELFDGDIGSGTRRFCVAMQANEETVAAARARLGGSTAPELAPLPDRFLPEAVALKERLAFVGRIDRRGELLQSTIPWLMEMWESAARGDMQALRAGDVEWAWRRLHGR